jgi:hypothetical protein
LGALNFTHARQRKARKVKRFVKWRKEKKLGISPTGESSSTALLASESPSNLVYAKYFIQPEALKTYKYNFITDIIIN